MRKQGVNDIYFDNVEEACTFIFNLFHSGIINL